MSEAVADKQIKTADAVRQAIAELGIDAKSPDILVRAQEIAGRPIGKQTVYQYKSNIKQGRDAEMKDVPSEPAPKKKALKAKAKVASKPAPKRKTTEMHVAPAGDMAHFIRLLGKVADLVKEAGGKENVQILLGHC